MANCDDEGFDFYKPDDAHMVYIFIWKCKLDDTSSSLYNFSKRKLDEVSFGLQFICKCKLKGTSSSLHYFFLKT